MKRSTIIFILLGIIILLIVFKKPIKKQMSKLTRGYRNNNPGNIRKTAKKWKGEIEGIDKEFKSFSSMAYGYRAIFALLREYIGKGYNTIEKIINRYAPPSENVTSAYVHTVERRTGLSKDEILSFADELKMFKIVKAISFVENGIAADDTEVDDGYKLLKS